MIAVLTVILRFQFLILRHDCLRQIHHYSSMKTKRKKIGMSFSNAPKHHEVNATFFSHFLVIFRIAVFLIFESAIN